MESLRTLPSVDQVLRKLRHLDSVPQKVITNQVRAVLSEHREALRLGGVLSETPIEKVVEDRVRALLRPSLRPVINASGVILHTNLGRAPVAQFSPIPRYSNLEYDLEAGRRGKRDAHTAGLLEVLLGRPAIVVNNNAAAVYLVLSELAAGHEVLVSRGELIEIGDGFRIPEIMSRSGAGLREVGTTNRTRIEDYRQAITDRTRLILRVHPSNFRVTGFTARPELNELAELGRAHGLPVYEDLGSGCVVDLRPHGIDEPVVADSLAAGINLVSFSCDKLLGGPQSGIIAGDPELVQRVRRNPMYRALRVDKLIVETLETTLRYLIAEDWQAIPTLRMIFAVPEEIRTRAERVVQRLQGLDAAVRESKSAIGGGSTPDQTLPTWVIELAVSNPTAFERRLRLGQMPVLARIERDRIILDMRTVADEEEELLVAAIQGAAEAATCQAPKYQAPKYQTATRSGQPRS
jgi:L-seryl-tRNA(Ser) seleniumtransferase